MHKIHYFIPNLSQYYDKFPFKLAILVLSLSEYCKFTVTVILPYFDAFLQPYHNHTHVLLCVLLLCKAELAI